MTASELLAALAPVIEALEALGVRYYVGGSIASSVHGVPRSSLDADVVADLRAEHVAPLAGRLATAYYVDEGRVRDAVVARRSFNAIHLATMFKIDVFCARRRPFDEQALSRASAEPLDAGPDAPRYRVSSREDTALAKLEWFRAGGEASERQWTDVVGVLRAAGSAADAAYLRRWAAALEVGDLLERALAEAAGGAG